MAIGPIPDYLAILVLYNCRRPRVLVGALSQVDRISLGTLGRCQPAISMMARSPWDGAGLHPVHQCPESRAHLGRRQVHTVTMSGKDPLELVLSQPPQGTLELTP